MSLLIVIIIIYLGIPLAGLMFFIGAWKLRDVRPKRAKLVIWPLLSLIVVAGIIALLANMTSVAPNNLETGAAIIVGTIATIITIAALSLLIPLPDSGAAVGSIVFGLFCIAVAAFWAYELSTTNFSL